MHLIFDLALTLFEKRGLTFCQNFLLSKTEFTSTFFKRLTKYFFVFGILFGTLHSYHVKTRTDRSRISQWQEQPLLCEVQNVQSKKVSFMTTDWIFNHFHGPIISNIDLHCIVMNESSVKVKLLLIFKCWFLRNIGAIKFHSIT